MTPGNLAGLGLFRARPKRLLLQVVLAHACIAALWALPPGTTSGRHPSSIPSGVVPTEARIWEGWMEPAECDLDDDDATRSAVSPASCLLPDLGFGKAPCLRSSFRPMNPHRRLSGAGSLRAGPHTHSCRPVRRADDPA